MVRFCRLVFLAGLMMVLSTALYGSDNKVKNEVPGVKKLDWASTSSEKTIVWNDIKEDMNVVVKVINFNFIYYDLDVDISTETIVAYQVLNDVWKQMLSLPSVALIAELRGITKTREMKAYFLQILEEWREKLEVEQKALEEAVGSVPSTSTAFNSTQTIEDYLKRLEGNTLFDELEEIRYKAWEATLDFESVDEAYKAHLLYDRYLEFHQKLIKKIRAFAHAADLCINGKTFSVGKNKGGTLVNITLQAKAAKPGKRGKDEREIQYFVHSNLPLIFHVGMTVSVLEKLEFEKVEQFINEVMYGDYYQLVEEGNTDFDLSAFLSYEFYESDDLRWGASVTFGTDLKDPGENFYFGLSGRFRKVLITGGVAWNEVVRIDEKDKVPGIDLYRTITQERDAGWFIAFSFTLF